MVALFYLINAFNSDFDQDMARMAVFFRGLGTVVIFMSSMTGGLMLDEKNNYTKLGYFMIAAFSVWSF